jgi:hypothetical protein
MIPHIGLKCYIFHEDYLCGIHDDLHCLNYNVHGLKGNVIGCTLIFKKTPKGPRHPEPIHGGKAAPDVKEHSRRSTC